MRKLGENDKQRLCAERVGEVVLVRKNHGLDILEGC